MEDLAIECVDCGETFVFTTGEQEFYQERGLKETPKRCKGCRSLRRKRRRRRRHSEGSQAEEKTAAKKAEEERSVAMVPRTFWSERPEWVLDALDQEAKKNGSNGGNGRKPVRKRRRRKKRKESVAKATDKQPDPVAEAPEPPPSSVSN